jgi:hypothetical protein
VGEAAAETGRDLLVSRAVQASAAIGRAGVSLTDARTPRWQAMQYIAPAKTWARSAQ